MIQPTEPTEHKATPTEDGAVCSCGRTFRHADRNLAISNARRHADAGTTDAERRARHRKAVAANKAAERAAFDRLKRSHWAEYVHYVEQEKADRGIASRRLSRDVQAARRKLNEYLSKQGTPDLLVLGSDAILPDDEPSYVVPDPEPELTPESAPVLVQDDPDPLAPRPRRVA